MNTSKNPTITVSNMAEVLYLLDRSNRIISAGMETTMEGTRVFSVTLEGGLVEDDHSRYLTYGPCQLSRLGIAFSAVLEAIGNAAEAERAGGAQ